MARVTYTSTSDRLLHVIGAWIARCIYRVTSLGRETLPAGGFLLLPNHITWVDAIVLQLACPRPIRYIIDETIYRNALLNPIFRAVGCIPITSRRAKDATREAAERIRAGEIVCLFPEGTLTRSGTLLRLRRGYELIARHAECEVVPVWLDQLWGSIFSYKGGRFFTKWPSSFPYKVVVAFGQPLAAPVADIATVREELLKLGEICYSQRTALQENLAVDCLRGLKRKPFDVALVDGLDGSTLARGKLLGIAAALSRHLREKIPDRRVAVVLPAGQGAVIANLAVALAGKIPVNLNFTASREALESALRQAHLTHAISATPLRKKLPDFPWPADLLQLDEVLPTMKGVILLWWILSIVLPAALLTRALGLSGRGGQAEAILLFTSGSSGDPKGVVLSHRNILGNVSQFGAMLDAQKDEVILACLPFFHCFGCTVTLWYPLIDGVRIVTYPNPLEVGKIAALIEKHRATVMLATPTFLRAYLRKIEPPQLASLRLVITGAEKLPADLATAFEERFGKAVLQGYGLTETSPVVSVNLPEPKPRGPNDDVQPSSRAGSTGKLAPGMAAEIRHPETEARLSLHETGMLWLRGPNIFEGYLHDAQRTAEVMRDGWFKTGDLGRFDEDGFLFIEGRLSRFSKIGGEMVPHETIEQKIIAALGLEGQSERSLVVMGVPDEAKGEALVVLSSLEIDLQKLRADLSAAGVPNLWIPKVIRRIEAIPVLASGKLDLAKCKELATLPKSG